MPETRTTLALTFLLSAAIVVLAGTRLARSGDVIAARTRLGGLWVGSVFLAVATSLPELTTDISAVRMGAPDLAAGDLFGSSMANMLILAILSLLPSGAELFRKAALDHALYAALAISLTAVAAMFLLFRTPAALLGVGPGSLLLVAGYLAGTRAIFRHGALAREAAAVAELSEPPPPDEEAAPPEPTLRRAALTFAAASGVILLAAPLFARSANGIAELTGLGATFFGTWLVGFATSLPELVTSLAAVRLRAYDLAVGNLFGSNALNMTMFAALDVAHPGGPVFAAVSPVHAMSALAAIALMGTGLASLVYRAKGGLSVREPSSAIMLVTYVLGLALVYLRSVR